MIYSIGFRNGFGFDAEVVSQQPTIVKEEDTDNATVIVVSCMFVRFPFFYIMVGNEIEQ